MSIRRAKKRVKMDFIKTMTAMGFQPKNTRWLLRQKSARNLFEVKKQ